MENNIKQIMGWESSRVDGFDFGPTLPGQRIAQLKSAYNSFIICPRGLGW